jgi:hypothetical protein
MAFSLNTFDMVALKCFFKGDEKVFNYFFHLLLWNREIKRKKEILV